MMPEWLPDAWAFAEKAGPLGTLVMGTGWWLHWRLGRAREKACVENHAAEIERMTVAYKEASDHMRETQDKLIDATLGEADK